MIPFPGLLVRRLFPHIWQSLVSPIRVLIVGASFARFSAACDMNYKFLVTSVIRVFLLLLPYSPLLSKGRPRIPRSFLVGVA